MYQPDAFEESRPEVMHALIAAHPLALLISSGPEGLIADPVPFLVYPDEGPLGTLRAHVARANGHWRALQAAPDCLVVFQGPQSYVTPGWYPTKGETGKVVPTWNYVVVQARGRARVTSDPGWLRRQLDDLTLAREAARPAPWAVGDAPAPFVAAQMRGIVGIEIAITRLAGKWKVSQNRPEADRRGVHAGLLTEGTNGADMARLVADRGGLDPDARA